MEKEFFFENPKRTLRTANLLDIAAFLISIISAIITTIGISKIFPNSGIFAIIIPICMESARTINTWVISNYWKYLGWRKYMLTIVVGIGMIFSAWGISGYLNSSYAESNIKASPYTLQIESKTQQIKDLEDQNLQLSQQQERLEKDKETKRNQLISLKNNEEGNPSIAQNRLNREIDNLQIQINSAQNTKNKNINEIRNLRDSIADNKQEVIAISPELQALEPLARAFGLTDIIQFINRIIMLLFDPSVLILMIVAAHLRSLVKKIEAEELHNNSELKSAVIADIGLSSKLKSSISNLFKKGNKDKVIKKLNKVLKQKKEVKGIKNNLSTSIINDNSNNDDNKIKLIVKKDKKVRKSNKQKDKIFDTRIKNVNTLSEITKVADIQEIKPIIIKEEKIKNKIGVVSTIDNNGIENIKTVMERPGDKSKKKQDLATKPII